MHTDTAASSPRRNSGRRKLLVFGLVALATLLLVLGDVAIWARRVLLDTDEWVESAELVLENDAVRDAVIEYLIDEVDTVVDLDAVSMGALPDEAQGLADVASEASREWIRSVVPQILDSQQFRVAWLDVNERAHSHFVAIVRNDGSMLATVDGDKVVIDLQAALEELRDISVAAGGSFLRGVPIPDDVGTFTLVDDDQVGFAGDGINVLDTVAPVLLIVAVALYAGAVLLSKVKWKTMIVVGSCSLGVAVLVWILLIVGREAIGGSIPQQRPAAAAEALFDIATRDLRTQSIILGVLGAGVLGVGLALGPFAWAENLRARGRGGQTAPVPAPAGVAPTTVLPAAPPAAPPPSSGRPVAPPPGAAPAPPPAAPPPPSGPPSGPPPGRPATPPPSPRRPPPAYPPGS